MRVTVRNSEDKEAVKQYIDRLPPKEYDIEIGLHKSKRSNAQNGIFWKWVEVIAKETKGNTEAVHKALCKKFLGWDEHQVCGERIGIVHGTSKLNVDEMTAFLDKVESYAYHELNIILPHPKDRLYELYE